MCLSTLTVEEFLVHAVPDYLVRGPDLFSLRLSNKKWQQPTRQQQPGMNESELHLLFFQIGKQWSIFFGSLMNFSNWFICAMRWKRVKIAGLNKDSHSAITDPDHLLKNRGRKVGKVGMCLCVCVCVYVRMMWIFSF